MAWGRRAPLTLGGSRRSYVHYGTSPLTNRSRPACCIQHRDKVQGHRERRAEQQKEEEGKYKHKKKRRASFDAGVRTAPWTLPPPRTHNCIMINCKRSALQSKRPCPKQFNLEIKERRRKREERAERNRGKSKVLNVSSSRAAAPQQWETAPLGSGTEAAPKGEHAPTCTPWPSTSAATSAEATARP